MRDASFCHGAAGLAHVFNRFYQTTGDPELGLAAREWVKRTLGFRVLGQGIAGYQSLHSEDPTREPQWVSMPGLLSGVSGIGLMLLAAATDISPEWDRPFLPSGIPA